jgi:hypothetical protein
VALRRGKGADDQAAAERLGVRHGDVQPAAAADDQAGAGADVVADHHVRHPGNAGRQVQAVDEQVGAAVDQQAALAALADAHGGQVADRVEHLRRRVDGALARQHRIGAVGQRDRVRAQRDDSRLGARTLPLRW